MIVGAAFGGAAIQSLHPQAKLKAYSISELDVLMLKPKRPMSLVPEKRSREPMVALYGRWDGSNT